MLDELEGGDWRGLALTGKPLVFAAGADLTQFPGITPERARQGGQAGHALFGRVRALPFPTLAAVNGAALGGGLEIALHCDFRTLAVDVRHLGFPEVFLGLIPAWGGTQLLPRLVGAEAAVELIVDNPLKQNRLTRADEALELGLVDHLLEPVEFLDESIEWLVRTIEAEPPPRADADLADVAEVVRKARARVDDAVHGEAPAPYRALELIEGAARWTIEEGYAAEEDALADLLPGDEAQAAIYAFDVVERRIKAASAAARGRAAADPARRRRRRRADGDPARDAVPAPARGARRDHRRRRRAGRRRRSSRSAASSRGSSQGRLTEGKARFLGSIVRAGDGLDAYAGCDLVLEAVFEELGVKREVFAGARGRRRARVPPRHEHVVALGDGDGRAASAIPSASSGCTSSTRSRCCRSSRSCARRRPTTRRSRPPGT